VPGRVRPAGVGGGDAERAALLAGAAEGLRRRVGLRAWPLQRQGEAELVAQIRQALGPDRFEEVFAVGARLNQQEAVAAVRDRRGASTTGAAPARRPPELCRASVRQNANLALCSSDDDQVKPRGGVTAELGNVRAACRAMEIHPST
jgi:hypothetical protein